MNKDIWVLLDFNAMVTHSYFSGVDPDANLIEGKKVNTAGYGLQVIIERYLLNIARYAPLNHIIVVHDDLFKNRAGEFTDLRTLYYPDYKKARRNKPASPEGKVIAETRLLARNLFTALGVPQVHLKNVEADDVISYLAQNLPGEKHIYTVDADLISLAQDPNVHVFLKLERKMDMNGIEPKLVTLYKSMIGDTSDGYGGVKGFGPAKWEEFNQTQLEFLDKVIQNKDWNKLQEAYDRTQSKGLKILLDNKQEWVRSYHILAKLHPELVDAKPVASFGMNDDGEEVEVLGTEFNRLVWTKKIPSKADLEQVLNVSGTDYLFERLEKFLPTQTLVTPANLDLPKIKQQLMYSRYVSLDWETWQVPNENFKKANQGKEFVDMLGSTISGMGITIGDNLEHTYYFQFDHADKENNLNKQVLLEVLDAIPSTMPVIAFGMYFEIAVLISEFKVTLPIMYDPMVMHKHIDELSENHGLKDLTKRYFGYNQLHYEDVIEKGKTMQDYTGQHVFQYGADDPLVTAHLFDLFQIILHIEHTWEFVRDCEFPTIQLLAESYVDGVSFDLEAVESQRAEDQAVYDTCLARMRELLKENAWNMAEMTESAKILYLADINPKGTGEEPEVEELAKSFLYSDIKEIVEIGKNGKPKKPVITGTQLNLDSPKQMQYLFYGTLGLPIRIRDFKISDTRKAKGLQGTPQVNDDAVTEAIFNGDATGWKQEVLENFSKAKKCATRVKLFHTKFPLWLHPKDGNVHPRFNSCGTESRRPTGGSPNLLQLSKKGEGAKVRRAIVPNRNKGHNLVCSADFSAEELRIIGGVAQDQEMLSCYLGDNLKDAHSQVGAQIAGCSYEEFVAIRKGSEGKERAKEFDDIRKKAKSTLFGSNYSIGAAKLARTLHVSEEDAKLFLEAKRRAYWRMEDWKQEVKEVIEKTGSVTTLYGSKKHLYSYYTKADEQMKRYYERSSVNYIIQATASDYLKKVLSDLHKRGTFRKYNATFIAGVYDELLWSAHSSVAVPLMREICEVMMQGIPGLGVPMLVNPAVGINFCDQIEVLEDENQVITDELIQIAIDKALGGEK
jgi:DNA polymerase I-like protein with 3'-5' exonuclease and polymerase domains/5'-3' exonuclease